MMEKNILIRYNEIHLKGRNRHFFEDLLFKNMQNAISEHDAELKKVSGRSRSFDAIGADVVVTADEKVLRNAARILLPGVGAFGDAADKLRNSGLADLVTEQAKQGKPLLGICLGMQLLFDVGYEYGVHQGLGLISGDVCPIAKVIPGNLKIPHMGWNALEFTRDSKLFSNIH